MNGSTGGDGVGESKPEKGLWLNRRRKSLVSSGKLEKLRTMWLGCLVRVSMQQVVVLKTMSRVTHTHAQREKSELKCTLVV